MDWFSAADVRGAWLPDPSTSTDLNRISKTDST
jgi:hypothetical protein